jgi:hypothetical protein
MNIAPWFAYALKMNGRRNISLKHRHEIENVAMNIKEACGNCLSFVQNTGVHENLANSQICYSLLLKY